ncbi:MAG: arabinan endo-1,5-alpha-L-arabinosidase [Limisphaerales bacterium]
MRQFPSPNPPALARVACLPLLGLLLASTSAWSQPAQPYWQAEVPARIHDPSTLVRDGEVYWMFATGPGLKAYSSTNLRHWTPAPAPLPVMPDWVRDVVPDQRGYYWAPDLIRGDDRWLLYYSVSSWGKNDSALALLTTTNLGTPEVPARWTDEGIVLRSYRTNDFNAIDPAAFRDRDGRLWLSFGSFWSGIKLVELDPRTGRPLTNAPLHSLAWKEAIEAPFLWRRDSHYYLFVNWGQCCRGTNSTYEIRVGRAPAVTGPYLDRDGKNLLHGGGTLVLGSEGRFIGPGHAGILREGDREWFSFHYYNGDDRGRPTIAVRPLTWDADGWPVVGPESP